MLALQAAVDDAPGEGCEECVTFQLALFEGRGGQLLRHRDECTACAQQLAGHASLERCEQPHLCLYLDSSQYGPTARRRRLTAIWYLNWWRKGHGGELRLQPEGEDEFSVEPSLDRLVLFRANMTHAVAPSAADARWALTMWVHETELS